MFGRNTHKKSDELTVVLPPDQSIVIVVGTQQRELSLEDELRRRYPHASKEQISEVVRAKNGRSKEASG
jgi:hypothetical protein